MRKSEWRKYKSGGSERGGNVRGGVREWECGVRVRSMRVVMEWRKC